MDFIFQIVDFLIDYYGPIPYIAIFCILLLCGLGVPIPEDITLIATGVLCYYGICDIWIAILVGLAGVLIGDSFMYFLGYHFGRKLLTKWPFKLFLNEKKIDAIQDRLNKHGNKLFFSARFMPGVRSTIFFAIGMLHLPYRRLIFWDGLAALISVPAIIYSVYHFGDILENVFIWIKKIEGGIVAVIALIALYFLFKYYKSKNKPVGDL